MIYCDISRESDPFRVDRPLVISSLNINHDIAKK